MTEYIFDLNNPTALETSHMQLKYIDIALASEYDLINEAGWSIYTLLN